MKVIVTVLLAITIVVTIFVSPDNRMAVYARTDTGVPTHENVCFGFISPVVGYHTDVDKSVTDDGDHAGQSSSSRAVDANFSATPVSGKVPLTVQFTDLSTDSPTSWAWDFDNDGTIDSNNRNPSYTFNSNGAYTVNLTVSNGTTGDTEIKTDYIEVCATALSLEPNSGLMNTVTPITVTGCGFGAAESGIVWFDTDKDGVMDGDEPGEAVTTTIDGTLSIALNSPLLLPSQWYFVRADIPSGPDIESSAVYTTPATTTGVIITRYNPYGTAVNQTRKSWEWMSSNLTVYGDGATHYYFQGPTFDSTDFDAVWDPGETVNIDSRDYGAVRGTDVKDLCELAGGAFPGDVIGIRASDNFVKYFDYDDIYNPEPDQGRMLLTWYTVDSQETGDGYVTENYTTGMRLVFFTETLTPDGKHVFGVWDMHETLPESRWHYYSAGGGVFWPSSSGLSVKYVYHIDIYQPNLISCNSSGYAKDSFLEGETVYVKGKGLSPDTGYDIWVQDEPVSNNRLEIVNGVEPRLAPEYLFRAEYDPSGSQEIVTTDGNGDFGPSPVWTIAAGDDGGHYDIIADSLGAGTAGTLEQEDFIDSSGWHGFSVVVSPTANFTADVTSGTVPLTVNFTEQSTGNPTAWAWDFNNDGTTDSTLQNPSYTYTAAGTYSVNLTVTNAAGNDSTLKADYITVTAVISPAADFSAAPVSGNAPLAVQFTDQSTGNPTVWAWDFNNDGTTDSTLQNPSYTYTAAGTYSVNLTVTNAAGSDSKLKTNYISVTTPPINTPVADFSAVPLTGTAPLNVFFTDYSIGSPTAWAWDFNNDGTTDSTAQNPTYCYTESGSYTVKLTVSNSYGTDFKSRINYIQVAPGGTGTTSVTVSRYDSDGNPLDSETVTWEWMRDNLPVQGDGVTHYYFQGPTFDNSNIDALWDPGEMVNIDSRDYGAVMGTDVKDLCGLVGGASPGATIKVKARDNFFKIFDYEDVYYPEPEQGRIVVSWYTKDAQETDDGYVPEYDTGMRLMFFAETLNPEGKHVFGLWDMHETLAESRWHYYYDGEYWPSSSGLSVKFIRNVEIHESDNPLRAHFTADITSGSVPLTVAFTDLSTGSPSAWAWDFNNDGTADSTEQSPSYTYTIAGTYTVKLTVTTASGTDFEVKTDYIKVTVIAGTPAAGFTANVTSGTAPLPVSFTDQSAGNPTSWAWDFNNDGTVDSIARNPSFTYTSAGTYSVKLKVTNTTGSDSMVKTDYITVTEEGPEADFIADVTSGTVPLTVHFTDLSEGNPEEWAWDFDNNGTTDSTEQNPAYTYDIAGTFTVKLRVTTASGTDSEVKTDYITVNAITEKDSVITSNTSSQKMLPERKTSGDTKTTEEAVVSSIGINISTDSIMFGYIEPGKSSEIRTVTMKNPGDIGIRVTLEVQGVDPVADAYFMQSLYVNGILYSRNMTIAALTADQSQNLQFQIKVPSTWRETGTREAIYIFWVEAE